MRMLVVLNHAPYDGTDVAWNALRFVGAARAKGHDVRLFLVNEGVEVARQHVPDGAEFDLPAMIAEALHEGVETKLCGTCVNRCGISRAELVVGVVVGGMADFVDWVAEADRVLSF